MVTEITPAHMDWMRHGVLLCRERLDAPIRMSSHEIEWLKWETAAREAALAGMETGELTGARLIVARYMLALADLHIAWYARQVTDSAFYAGARAARAAMVEQLKAARHAV